MIPDIYSQDGLTTGHDHEFMAAPPFVEAYRRGVAAAGRDYAWRLLVKT